MERKVADSVPAPAPTLEPVRLALVLVFALDPVVATLVRACRESRRISPRSLISDVHRTMSNANQEVCIRVHYEELYLS